MNNNNWLDDVEKEMCRQSYVETDAAFIKKGIELFKAPNMSNPASTNIVELRLRCIREGEYEQGYDRGWNDCKQKVLTPVINTILIELMKSYE